MIRNRPRTHFSLPHYQGLPPLPYQLDMSAIPEAIRLSLLPLRYIEPLGLDVIDCTGEFIEKVAEEAELSFYKEANTKFQIILVVINSIFSGREGEVSKLLPYSISLIPASKRGNVELVTARSIENLQGASFFDDGAAYIGLDPFSGEWSLFSQLGLIADLGSKSAITDELGLVYDYFFLRTDCATENIAQAIAIDMPEARLTRYLRHRAKLLYTPFDRLTARQIWGVENALELFVYQEFQRQDLPHSIPQALIFNDGSYQPSLYHVWEVYERNTELGLISECDFFFPEAMVAVFCDGATHNRARIKERDVGIDRALLKLGIRSIRLKSRDILQDVEQCVSIVKRAIC